MPQLIDPIDEWKTGVRKTGKRAPKFTTKRYLPVYNFHMEQLTTWATTFGRNGTCLAYQRELFANARYVCCYDLLEQHLIQRLGSMRVSAFPLMMNIPKFKKKDSTPRSSGASHRRALRSTASTLLASRDLGDGDVSVGAAVVDLAILSYLYILRYMNIFPFLWCQCVGDDEE